MRYAVLGACLAAWLALVGMPVRGADVAPGQTSLGDDEYNKAFDEQQKVLSQQTEDLRGLIDRATASMSEIKQTDLQNMTMDTLRKPFLEFRAKIENLLQRFDDQGDFTIALQAAATSAVRALRWWQGQPPSDEQQKMIQQLTGTVNQFQEADGNRKKMEDACKMELRNILTKQLTMERIARTNNIVHAAQQLQEVLNGLSSLTKSLGDLGKMGSHPPTGS